MIVGILSARSRNYHPNRRLLEAASELGHRAVHVHPRDCLAAVLPEGPTIPLPSSALKLDVLLPRIGATINEYALGLVRHFELSGIPVVNSYGSILLARSQFMTLQTLAYKKIPLPRSYCVSNAGDLEEAVKRLGGFPVVLKTLNSRQGKGVMLLESFLTGRFIMDNLPARPHGYLVQEFIPPDNRRDFRVLVMGGEIAAAMEMRPKPGEFRSNIHLNGKGTPVELGKELSDLAVEVSKTLGLDIAGTDIIIDSKGSPKVIEANYSAGFKGLEAATGRNIAKDIMDYVTRIFWRDREYCLSDGSADFY